MAPTKNSQAVTKKEKLFHPQSRKAGQLIRASLRKDKIQGQASKRGQKYHTLVDLYSFYHSCLPVEGALTLAELHHFLSDVWLTRFDKELQEEKAARRKGRPKSANQVRLEETKLREAEAYRTGLEVIDLTHSGNVELFRKWDQKEVAYVEQLRFIRINCVDPTVTVLSRRGQHPSLADCEIEMDEHGIVEGPIPRESIARFSSTMMSMDSPIAT
ncbi:hypothetical protein AMATHDRAFT_2661 [Amanita thiersii Skay4041]|uniref:Translation machinery-associated protein 16 n=1 Tax=Amanita thiersii Skay4041 TaxID=703135 RepID=A0A2A9NUK9_9AGAR|nr:hypothetical protein AMATHDRAFT_2661 [Amanita thiersii Skay4041]